MGASEKQIKIDPAHAEEIASDEEKLHELVRCATDFGHFLRYWHFVNQETGSVEVLGDVLWAGQLEFVETVARESRLFALKARKLGYTTIECAYDAWVLRFGPSNARVHLFSRRQAAAEELLDAVRFGLRRLPEWMRLPPGEKDNSTTFELDAGEDDRRLLVAYPADEETAVEATCNHGHVDEWARMRNPKQVWQAIEPSMAGSCHLITTGRGPANWSSHFWRKCMAGDTGFLAFFQDALKRSGRDAAWLKKKKEELDEVQFRQEYPMTWQDALFGGGGFVFAGEELDKAGRDALGIQPMPAKGRKYLKVWDIGRHQDAAVGMVLDITEDVQDVVAYWRHRGIKYPELQQRIEAVHHVWPGPTFIEDNSAGEAVRENLDLPEREVEGFKTTGPSKARIITKLKVAFQNELLKYDPVACHQLDAELRAYQLPDDDLVQDSVMTLAIGHDRSAHAILKTGKVKGVMTW